mgnify:CR=1 FL=1
MRCQFSGKVWIFIVTLLISIHMSNQINDRSRDYEMLRSKHPVFTFESYGLKIEGNRLHLKFHFSIGEDHHFYPATNFPLDFFPSGLTLPMQLIDELAFHIGMAESISYWKTACPRCFIIKDRQLSQEQMMWWKKLFLHGLGEFFYLNGLEPQGSDLVEFFSDTNVAIQRYTVEKTDQFLVPVGGGKDSTVSLEMLRKAGYKITPLILNPREASMESCYKSGYRDDDIFRIFRSLDPHLLELNELGYLNGHTPFSALLAFNGLLAAILSGTGHIALSNESSANEATIVGSGINHQYSKSYEFEKDFREYVNSHLLEGVEYFSLLRPLNEIQIAMLFSGLEHHFGSFRSCNTGSKTNSWCCACPKCLFTYIILSPFVDPGTLQAIFGEDLYQKEELSGTLDELTGCSYSKPFECIGTTEEVNAACILRMKKYQDSPLPLLLQHYQKSEAYTKHCAADFSHLFTKLGEPHFVEPALLQLIKSEIHVRYAETNL